MVRNKVEVDLALRDRLSRPMRQAQNSVSGLTNRISRLGRTASLVAGVGGGLGLVAGLTAFGKSSISAAREVEDLEVRLISLKGSQTAATQTMKSFTDVAAKVPFSLQEVAQAGTTLEAMTGQSEALLPVLTDVAAVMGLDLPTAASALGRAFSSGAGAADVFRERGILNVVKDFAKIDDLSKLSLPEFRKAMLGAFTDPGGKIAGASARLSQTLTGQLSMVGDSVFKLTSTFGKALLPAIKDLVSNQIRPLVQGWADWIKANEGLIKTKADEFIRKVAQNAKSAAVNLAAVLNALGPIVNLVIQGWALLPSPVRELGLIAALLLGPKGAAIAATITLAAGGIQKIISLTKESAEATRQASQSSERLDQRLKNIEKRAQSLESRGFSRLAQKVREEALPAITEFVKGYGDAAVFVEDFSDLLSTDFNSALEKTGNSIKVTTAAAVNFGKEAAKSDKETKEWLKSLTELEAQADEFASTLNMLDGVQAGYGKSTEFIEREQLRLAEIMDASAMQADEYASGLNVIDGRTVGLGLSTEELTEQIKKNQEVLNRTTRTVKSSSRELNDLQKSAQDAGRKLKEAFGGGLKRTIEDLTNAVIRIGRALESGLSDALFALITGRFESLKDIAISVAHAIARAFTDLAAAAIVRGIFGLASNLFGGTGSLVGSLFQGALGVGGQSLTGSLFGGGGSIAAANAAAIPLGSGGAGAAGAGAAGAGAIGGTAGALSGPGAGAASSGASTAAAAGGLAAGATVAGIGAGVLAGVGFFVSSLLSQQPTPSLLQLSGGNIARLGSLASWRVFSSIPWQLPEELVGPHEIDPLTGLRFDQQIASGNANAIGNLTAQNAFPGITTGQTEALWRRVFLSVVEGVGSVHPHVADLVSRITFAARGFSGIVSRPTLFMAGEAGSERVEITPRGRRHGGLSGVVINIMFNAPVSIRDERDTEILSRELARRIDLERTVFA